MYLQPGIELTEEELDDRTTCVYWDPTLEGGIGDWSEFGCKMAGKDEDGNIMCECTHLTSFAILLVCFSFSQTFTQIEWMHPDLQLLFL